MILLPQKPINTRAIVSGNFKSIQGNETDDTGLICYSSMICVGINLKPAFPSEIEFNPAYF